MDLLGSDVEGSKPVVLLHGQLPQKLRQMPPPSTGLAGTRPETHWSATEAGSIGLRTAEGVGR